MIVEGGVGNMDKSYFIDSIKDELEARNIKSLSDVTIGDIASIASDFFGMIEVRGHVYCGIEGYLQHVYGCMLSDGVKVSDVPELVAMQKEIDTFLEYTEKYLGFKDVNGGFEEVKK